MKEQAKHYVVLSVLIVLSILILSQLNCAIKAQARGAPNTIVTAIPVGSNPVSVAYDSAKNRIYVANQGSNDVSVIDGKNDTVVKKILVGENPSGIAYDSANKKIYVANEGSNTVSVIDPDANKVINVTVGTSPRVCCCRSSYQKRLRSQPGLKRCVCNKWLYSS